MAKHLATFVGLRLVVAPQEARSGSTTFSQMVVFGDSLSDTGNLSSVLGVGDFLVPPKYTTGRFTGGAYTPRRLPRTNFATQAELTT